MDTVLRSTRIAVVLWGEAFRDWDFAKVNTSCCDGSDQAQASIARSHEAHVFVPLEALGYTIDVHISTYRCTNGRSWAEETLPRLYGKRLRSISVATHAVRDTPSDLQGYDGMRSTRARGIALAANATNPPFACLILRLDHSFEIGDGCIARSTVVRDGCWLSAGKAQHVPGDDGRRMALLNRDRFVWVPGRYFSALVRHRSGFIAHPTFYGRLGAPMADCKGDAACSQQIRVVKRTATSVWMREGRNTEPPASATHVPCACGAWVHRRTGILARLERTGELLEGGCPATPAAR